MKRDLPPLNSLKAFESAARLGNFSKAANELGVTQGAISKQVKTLEDYLGTKLFNRHHQTVEVTKIGSKYERAVADALNDLAKATNISKQQPTEILIINILPTLSSRWLIPLLENYKSKYPNIKVKVETGIDLPNFETTDLAIRVAKNNGWRQYHVEKLMSEELLPVCIPTLLKNSITQSKDLLKYQLLEHTNRPMMWEQYLKAVGFKAKVSHRYSFEHFFMLIQAALDGLGIALIPKILIEQELTSGKLIVAFKDKYKSPYSYYLICPRQQSENKKLRMFRKWLLQQIS